MRNDIIDFDGLIRELEARDFFAAHSDTGIYVERYDSETLTSRDLDEIYDVASSFSGVDVYLDDTGYRANIEFLR